MTLPWPFGDKPNPPRPKDRWSPVGGPIVPLPNPKDVRKDFWEIVGKIDRLSEKHHLPVPQLRPILQQFELVDGDLLRRVGEDVWGTGGGKQGIPAQLALTLPAQVEAAKGKAAERWKGKAYEQFAGSMDDLKTVLGKFPEPAEQVGQMLVDLADKFKLSWLEIIGYVGGIAGLVVGLIALVDPPTSALGIVTTTVGLILGVIGVVISTIQGLGPRLDSASNAVNLLTKKVNAEIPGTDDAPIQTPKTPDWKRKTADPTT